MNVKKYIKMIIAIVGTFIILMGGLILARFFFGTDTSVNLPQIDSINIFSSNKKINVLVMGTDESGQRSDVMILASLNTKERTVNLLSIPRDTRVRINNGYGKINAALYWGGEDLAIKKVQEITGIPINYYVVVNFNGFRNIIDILGGVDFNVPTNMYYKDPYQKLLIDLKKGEQHLNGAKAEMLVRYRRYTNGDIDRIKVQQDFLRALVEQKLTPENILKIDDIYKEVMKNVKTDFDAAELAKNLGIIKLLKPENIKMYQLPGEAKMINGDSFIIHNPEKTLELIEGNFGYSNE